MAKCSHENVKLLKSALWSYDKIFKKNHSGKIAELAAEHGSSISGLRKADISGRRVFKKKKKEKSNTYHQK